VATPTTRRIEQDTLPQASLYLAFELGKNTWKLGFTIGVAHQPRERTIPAGDVTRLQQEIARAKQRFGLPEDTRIVSCYEAGRDGFWLHRYLVAHNCNGLQWKWLRTAINGNLRPDYLHLSIPSGRDYLQLRLQSSASDCNQRRWDHIKCD
jgi:hypothetical protein